MKKIFESLDWHDATLESLFLDRSQPGVRDEIVLKVIWPDESVDELLFKDCYRFESTLNFGIIATESVEEARCFDSSTDLDDLRVKWKA